MKLCIASIVVCGAFGILTAADWPQFLGPNRDNVGSETGLIKTFPKEGPKVLWTVDVGPGFGGPAIEGGMVYILDRDGEKGDIARCLDLATGEQKWSYAYTSPGKFPYNGSRSTPLVDKDYVYTIGMMGDMNCISKTTHKPVWTVQLLMDSAEKVPQWGVSQSPVAYKDTIIVAPLTRGVGLAAFSRDKGEIVWRSEPIGLMKYPSPYVTKIDGVDQVIMISATGKDGEMACVTGVDAAKGSILWTYDKWVNKLPIASPLNVGDGKIFICGGYSGDSLMLDVKKTADKWSAGLAFTSHKFTSYNANPVLYKGCLYSNGTMMRVKNGFQCMDLKGNFKWQTMPAPEKDGAQSKPARATASPEVDFGLGNIMLAGDVIFAINGDTGELAMIEPNPDGYKELARAKVLDAKDKTAWAPLALSDGKLIVRDQHQMKCLDVKAAQK